MNIRYCKKCGVGKHLDQFAKNKSRPDGLQSWCKDCMRAANRKHYRADSTKSYYRKKHLSRAYGVTLAEYDRMLERQNSLCAVCGKIETSCDKNGAVKRLAVDHDHATGEIRGLLCTRCNTVLGLAGDSLNLLEELAHYLIRAKS